MAATYEAASAGYVASSSSINFNHTVGANSNRLLLVFVYTGNGAQPDASAVTFNSVSMTSHGTFDGGNCSVWKLVAPSSGTFAVDVTLTGATDAYAVAISAYNVDPTTPVDALDANYATGNPNFVSATGDLAVMFTGDSSGLTAANYTANQTLAIKERTDVLFVGVEYAAGAATVDMQPITIAANSPRYMGVNVNAFIPPQSISAITDPIVDASTGNSLIVSGFGSDITSLSLKDKVVGSYSISMTINSGSGDGPYLFSAPDVSSNRNSTGIAGMPFPSTYWGAGKCLATAGDGTNTAEADTDYDPISGWTVVEFTSGLDNTTPGTVQYGWSAAPAQYDQLYYNNYGGLVTIGTDGGVISNKTTGIVEYQYFDQSDGKMKYSYIFFTSLSASFYTWIASVITGNEHLTDKWMTFLDTQGISSGSLNDRWFEWLTGLGYTQHSLVDKIKAWEVDNI